MRTERFSSSPSFQNETERFQKSRNLPSPTQHLSPMKLVVIESLTKHLENWSQGSIWDFAIEEIVNLKFVLGKMPFKTIKFYIFHLPLRQTLAYNYLYFAPTTSSRLVNLVKSLVSLNSRTILIQIFHIHCWDFEYFSTEYIKYLCLLCYFEQSLKFD